MSRRSRSKVMASVHSSGSKPELVVRKTLHELTDLPLCFNVKALPGTPDIVIQSIRLIIFVDGCQFHGCPEHYKAPRTNARFWAAKMARIIRHGFAVRTELRAHDWTVVGIWEHDIKNEVALKHKLKNILTKLIDSPDDDVA